ncbi:MAG: molybdopterin-synthase adenylyltransferase MoeB, partial [Bacteroidota bacterium]
MGPQLSAAEKDRYARHLILPDVGENGQLKLKQAKVIVIGAGGLGSPVLQYLAAAGVGTIGIVDPDRVSSSNLQRQVLYGQKDLGRPKVRAAKDRLLDLNPLITIHCYETSFRKENAFELLKGYDLLIDGTDNFPTRYLVNDACVLAGIPYIYGSIFRFEGQVSVFNALQEDTTSRGPNYRDLYPTPPAPGQVPNCAEGGVLGVLAGIIGSIQANEAIKLICGIGELLDGRMLLFDAASFSKRILRFSPNPSTNITQLIDYELFCGMPSSEGVPSLDVNAFLQMKTRGEKYFLLDVREEKEYQIHHINGYLLPLSTLESRWKELPANQLIIVHCQSGKRSAQAV